MDTMDREIGQNYDEVFAEEPQKTKMLEFEAAQKKRAPFCVWKVGSEEYKLRLTASTISKLENTFRKNLLLALTDDGLPPIADMLLTIQGAIQQYQHGITMLKVQGLYDQYVDEGGDQMKLMADVIMPLLSVSGFFTAGQEEILAESMKDLDSSL